MSHWLSAGRLALFSVAALTASVASAVEKHVVSLPGGGMAVTWSEPGRAGPTHYYSVSFDGQNFSREIQTSYELKLRFDAFDPLLGEPLVPAELSSPAGSTLRIVQFVTQPVEPLQSFVALVGGQVQGFMAENAVVATLPAEAEAVLGQQPFVRAIVPFHPAYKLDETILAELAAGARPDSATSRYSIMLFPRGPAAQAIVANAIDSLGGTVHFTVAEGFRLEATLTPSQLLAVAGMDEVEFIDPWGPAGLDMDNARLIGGAVPILTGAGFTGQGVRGEAMDSGLRVTHEKFTGPGSLPAPLIHNTNSTDTWHGTNVYGEVFGNTIGNAGAIGMLPDREQGIFAAYTPIFNGTFSRYTHTAQLVDPNGPYRGVFQTNSWGNPQTTVYNTISAEMDDILFIHDVIITQSQSNTGNQNSRPQAWAKNIVAVGGIAHQNTLSRTDDTWTSASIGPAQDGRIKPDLAHFYDNILTATDTSNTAYNTGFNGTSGATPIVCGHFGLLFQMWHNKVWTGHGGDATVFDSRAHMTTAKALMINFAYRYNWLAGGPNGNLNRFRQGWGMPEIGTMYNARTKTYVVDEQHLLAPLKTNEYNFVVPAGEPELRVTLVYADPKGPVSSTQHRINDLSLRVTAPGGTTYWGNNGLTAGNFSTAGGAANKLDTVENVFIQNPPAGTWKVEVLGDEIVQDSHVETAALDADYALVAVGVTMPVGCPGDINLDGVVDQSDLGIFLAAFGSSVGQAAYNAPADLNTDGVIDQADLGILLAFYGSKCPS